MEQHNPSQNQPANPVVAAGSPIPVRKKSIIYIDGFNFYYGMLHDRPELKWLNFQRMAELLRPDDDIFQVKLFTALVDTDKHLSEKRDRQKRLWRAFGTQLKMKLILGKFAERERECLVYSCPNRQKFWATEEKQTDVNIALNMVRDASELQPQVMVLISGDIDLIPALAEVKRLKPIINLVVYVPCTDVELKFRRKDEFGKHATVVKPIPEKFLPMAQFPKRVDDCKGGIIERPVDWPPATPPSK